MEYKMKLTDEQLGILNGERGATMAKVMKTLVLFGDVFGAEKLVPVTHKQGHLVTSFGIGLLKPLFRTMDELISAVRASRQAGVQQDHVLPAAALRAAARGGGAAECGRFQLHVLSARNR